MAMIFAAIIALSLGSYVSICTQSTSLAYRSFYAGAAMNAAETGLEQAMWSVNKQLAGNSNAWTDWTIWTGAGTDAVRRTFTLQPVAGGATAQVKVFVSSRSLAGAPWIIARSIITPKQGKSIERWIRITLARRNRFATGMVAKDSIRFNGNNASVDSYDSRRGAYNAALSGGGNNRYDRGTAGSSSVAVNSFALGQADIWGNAVIGTSDLSGLSVGTQGTVGPFGTAAGTVVRNNVLTDFTADFDDVPHPPTYTGSGSYSIVTISSATTLPRATDLPAADGKYYYNIDTISLGGNATNILTIASNVVIRTTSSLGTAITIGGNASIRVNAPSGTLKPSLEIFTQSNVSIAGNGVANPNKPDTFFLWGTRPQSDTTRQSITINGNGVLSSVVYAPHADISLHGGGNSGDVFGSIIGKTVTVTGNSAFHYDESLGALNTGEPLGLKDWIEYVSYADRQVFARVMNF